MPPSGRIPELDAIRAIAILLVIFWHYGVEVSPTLAGFSLFRLTWSGVDLFFVLSGFLIGGNLLAARHSPHYYKTFYLRRSFRILPLYACSLVLFLIASAWFTNPESEPLTLLFGHQLPFWSYPVFLQNFLMSWRQHYGAGWLSVTWSLTVEEQFYLLLPFLIRNWTPRRLTQAAFAAFLFAISCRLLLAALGNPLVGPYTLLPCRLDAFAGGLLIALAIRNEALWRKLSTYRLHFALAACLLLVLMLQTSSYIYWLSLLAVFYSLILFLVLTARRTGLLRHPALLHTGLISYFIYLFHQPLNGLLHYAVFEAKPSLGSPAAKLTTLASLLLVILFATLSWRYFERPLVRHSQSRYRY